MCWMNLPTNPQYLDKSMWHQTVSRASESVKRGLRARALPPFCWAYPFRSCQSCQCCVGEYICGSDDNRSISMVARKFSGAIGVLLPLHTVRGDSSHLNCLLTPGWWILQLERSIWGAMYTSTAIPNPFLCPSSFLHSLLSSSLKFYNEPLKFDQHMLVAWALWD